MGVLDPVGVSEFVGVLLGLCVDVLDLLGLTVGVCEAYTDF